MWRRSGCGFSTNGMTFLEGRPQCFTIDRPTELLRETPSAVFSRVQRSILQDLGTGTLDIACTSESRQPNASASFHSSTPLPFLFMLLVLTLSSSVTRLMQIGNIHGQRDGASLSTNRI